MTKLPFELQLPFFDVLLAKGDLSALENWIYQQTELEQYLSESDYFELISFDFQQKFALHELEKLLKNYLDYSAYYGYQLKHYLLTLQKDPPNLQVLAEIYEIYCDGYYFLQKLAMEYGYIAMSALENEKPNFTFSAENLAEIQSQARLLYTAIDTGKIILLEPPMMTDNEQYQDLRSDEERKLTQAMYSETKPK